MGAKLLIGTPWMRNDGVLKTVWAIGKCMVSMATHGEFENGGMPTKGLVCVLACSAGTPSARRRNAIQMAVR